jgi:hypothetical protein
MNNLNSKRVFTLLPNGFFFCNFGSTYFCGRYEGDCPTRAVEVELEFPFDHLFVSLDDFFNILRVNHTRYAYRYSTALPPALPLYLGGESHDNVGKFENIEYMEVRDGVLSANGVAMRLYDFPLSRFELSSVDIERANKFLSLGYTKVGFVYAWYKPVIFLSFNANWMTYYLRVRDSEIGIGR